MIEMRNQAGALFGLMIRGKRIALSMSLAQVSKAAGISRAYLCAVELGQQGMGPKALLRLAAVLDIDIERLRSIKPALRKRGRKARSRLDALGRFVTNRRLELGLTQVQFGATVSIDGSSISRLERGVWFPKTVDIRGRLEKALRIEIPTALL